MDCEKKPECILSTPNGLLTAECTRMKRATFQKLTIQSGERYVYLYCTQDSLEHRRDEIILWVDQLARQLCWRIYETTISAASTVEATKRKHALFEYR